MKGLSLKVFTLITTLLLFLHCDDDGPTVISGAGVFTTQAGNASIEGELFLPAGDGPFPSMILVPGSGNEPRQELEVFAQILTQNGYAMYIYDKRGVGNSTGSYPTETPETQTEFLTARAEDVISIINLLKEHIQIDNTRIGVHGSSQGAWVNSIIHSMSSDLSYIVMASGGVASTGVEGFYDGITDDPDITIEEATTQLSSYSGVIGFDPLSIINSMTLPVLWIYGNEDRSHPARYDVQVLEDLNRSNFTVQLYPNTGHELLDITTGEPPVDFYANLGAWLIQNN